MKKPRLRVFLSSTVYDLKNVRMAIKYVLEKYHEVDVLTSETGDFPLAINEHSYAACEAAVKGSHLLICVIQTRAGGKLTKADGTVVSITRKEFETAQESGIPTQTYVDLTTLNLVNDFKKFGDKPNWDKFFSQHVHKVQDPTVAEFLTYITSRPTNNWITAFITTYDLLASLEERAMDFRSYYWRDVFSPHRIDQIARRLDTNTFETELFTIDRAHRTINNKIQKGWVQYLNTMPDRRSALVTDLGNLIKENGHAFVRQYHKDLRLYGGKKRFLITDSSMDVLTPDIWCISPDHLNIMRYAKLQFPKGVADGMYRRILLFGNLLKVVQNEAYHRSIGELLELHNGLGTSLGVVSLSACKQSYIKEYGTNSFYVVEDVCVSIWDAEMGKWYYITKENDPQVYEVYLGMFGDLERMCTKGSDGIWSTPHEDKSNFLSRIYGLTGMGPQG